jgi:hypothetical protein
VAETKLLCILGAMIRMARIIDSYPDHALLLAPNILYKKGSLLQSEITSSHVDF